MNLEAKIKEIILTKTSLYEWDDPIQRPYLDEFVQVLLALFTSELKQQEEAFLNKFEEAYITIPKVDPNISDESITRFQANIMIEQGVKSVIDQLRARLQA